MEHYGKIQVICGIILLATTSCGAAFSAQMRDKVDHELRFPILAANPELHKGKIVVLGGEVISVTTLEKVTEMEVLEKPLSWDYRPKTVGSRGRFIVTVNGFMDPAEWKEGKEVSFIGKVSDHRNGKIGMKPYRYVVIEALEWRLWTEIPPDGYYHHCYPSCENTYSPSPQHRPWHYVPAPGNKRRN